MNKKIIFQIFVYFLIFFFIGLLAFQYSYDEKPKDISFSENNIDLNSNTNTSSNIMSNIEYKSTDTIGNQYLIRAKLGTISDEDSNVILMQDVKAEIQLDNSEKILISACLLYTSDAADDSLRVDLGGRRIIKKVEFGVSLRFY